MRFNGYRYRFDKGSKKFPCPQCEKSRLVRYVDVETGEYLPSQYGICDRKANCGYYLNPYKDGYHKQNFNLKNVQIQKCPKNNGNNIKLLNPIPNEILFETLRSESYQQNVFIQNLMHHVAYPFDPKDIEKVISQYYLGTVCDGDMSGGITFPFINIQGHVRAIQVKRFDQNNHTTRTSFIHSIIQKQYLDKKEVIPNWLKGYLKNEKIVACSFGEHLVNKFPLNPVALVEAPKTAIYATLYFGFPDNPANFLWLAVYNLSSLSYEKCKVLKGRKVYLFPDLSKNGHAFNLWSKKAKELQQSIPGIQVKVSDLLEINGVETEKSTGLDLADFIIKLDWRSFRPKKTILQYEQLPAEQIIADTKCDTIQASFSENGEKSEAQKTNPNCDSVPAFIDNNGRLFIETPVGKTFTVYPSIDDYNQRKCIPIFIDKNQIDLAFMKEVRLNLNTLSIDVQSLKRIG